SFHAGYAGNQLRAACEREETGASPEQKVARTFYRFAEAGNRQALIDAIRQLGQTLPLRQFDVWRAVKLIASEMIDQSHLLLAQPDASEDNGCDLVPPRQPQIAQEPITTAPPPPKRGATVNEEDQDDAGNPPDLHQPPEPRIDEPPEIDQESMALALL